MALSNSPFGFLPQDGILNTPYIQYDIANNADGAGGTLNQNLFTGDPIQWAVVGDGAGTSGTIVPAKFNTAGNHANNAVPTLGIFLGCEYFDPTGMFVRSRYWRAGTPIKAGTKIKANIARDPDIKYITQVSCMIVNTLANTVFNQTQMPQNFAFGLGGGGTLNNPATGSFATGKSAYFLNAVFSSNVDYTLATLPIKTLEYASGQNIYLANGTISPFVKLIVKLNNHIEHVGQIGYAAY
jgi:hypothetical protein